MTPAYIYFIQTGSNGPVKIGLSRNVYSRACALQTAQHEQLLILGTIILSEANTEAAVHRRFNDDRISGEWFRNSPAITSFISSQCVIWDGAQPTLNRKRKQLDLSVPCGGIRSEKLLMARAALGLTQVQLAKKAGMTQQAVARIENGTRRDPQLSTAQKLARSLGVSIDSLLAEGKIKRSNRGGLR